MACSPVKVLRAIFASIVVLALYSDSVRSGLARLLDASRWN
jgi:hypothetical protein